MNRTMLALSRSVSCVSPRTPPRWAASTPNTPLQAYAVDLNARSFPAPSTSYAPSFPLRPKEVAVWWLDPAVIPRSTAEKHAHWLNAEELSYIMSADGAAERHSRLCTRVMIRSAIATCLGPGIKLSDLKFAKNDHGKPLLCCDKLPKRARMVDFNHTNTNGLIGVAVACGAKVGIDVERIDRVPSYGALRVSKRMFSEAEFTELSEIGNVPQQTRHFMQQWTLKEAFVKATGRGLSASPGSKGFSILTSASDQLASLESLVISPGLCLRDPPRKLEVTSTAPDDLDSSFAMLQFRPSGDHIGSVCVQLDADENSPTDGLGTGWNSLNISMWSGMPGLNYDMVESRSPILAMT